MGGDHYQFIGMHFIWWVFWIILMISLFSIATPVRRKTVQRYRENHPLSILQRRYAAGEVTTEEYEDRKSRIERDLLDPKLQPLPVDAP